MKKIKLVKLQTWQIEERTGIAKQLKLFDCAQKIYVKYLMPKLCNAALGNRRNAQNRFIFDFAVAQPEVKSKTRLKAKGSFRNW